MCANSSHNQVNVTTLITKKNGKLNKLLNKFKKQIKNRRQTVKISYEYF